MIMTDKTDANSNLIALAPRDKREVADLLREIANKVESGEISDVLLAAIDDSWTYRVLHNRDLRKGRELCALTEILRLELLASVRDWNTE